VVGDPVTSPAAVVCGDSPYDMLVRMKYMAREILRTADRVEVKCSKVDVLVDRLVECIRARENIADLLEASKPPQNQHLPK
jgi:hypothetical protein